MEVVMKIYISADTLNQIIHSDNLIANEECYKDEKITVHCIMFSYKNLRWFTYKTASDYGVVFDCDSYKCISSI